MGTYVGVWVTTPGKLQCTCNLHVKFHVLSQWGFFENLNKSKFLKNGLRDFEFTSLEDGGYFVLPVGIGGISEKIRVHVPRDLENDLAAQKSRH